MSFENIIHEIDSYLAELLESEGIVEATEEQMERWPLDTRARPPKLFIGENVLLVSKRYTRFLDYYGGFEYVDKKHRTEVGSYVMYSGECGRVLEIIQALNGEDVYDHGEE